MNSENNPVQVVQRLYQAFGEGDMDALLGTLSEDTWWIYIGANPEISKKEYFGKEGVRRFVEELLQRVKITAFEPREFYAQENTVVVFGKESGVVRATDRSFTNEWSQKYVVQEGLIAQMIEYNIQTCP